MEPAPAIHYRLQSYGNSAGDDVRGDAHTEGEAQGVHFFREAFSGAGIVVVAGSRRLFLRTALMGSVIPV